MIKNRGKKNNIRGNTRVEQKRNVKKATKNPKIRKLKVFALYAFLLFIVVFAGVFLSLTVLFKIQSVEVVSQTRYNHNDIISACGIKKGENLFLSGNNIDKAAIQKNMPYIDNIDIVKKIPNKISIQISEANPKGIIYTDSKYILIDDKARILELLDTPMDNMIVIKVSDIKSMDLSDTVEFKNEDMGIILYQVLDQIRQNQIEDITEIDVTDPMNIMIKYQNRIKIKIGTVDNLNYKFRTAFLIINDEIKENERGVLDVSISSEECRSYFLPEYDI